LEYRRSTNWGTTTIEEIERAASDVRGEKSIKSVAKERNVDRPTMMTCMRKRETKRTRGYCGIAEELADHLKKLAEQFHGISPKKCVNCHLNGQTETGERKAYCISVITISKHLHRAP
uniref:HTH psq-type domain-containing protein n=1 Tax=Oryzias sinensis TaxID=183150 RepID=A0A8C7WU89_9TELE